LYLLDYRQLVHTKLYSFSSNILYIRLPHNEEKKNPAFLKKMALEVAFESAKRYML
jgi:hypothetical protein